MRHYMKYGNTIKLLYIYMRFRAVGSPVYLDEMLKQTMNNRYHEHYSSFQAFQQLINDIYESDQRESMVDLFQR